MKRLSIIVGLCCVLIWNINGQVKSTELSTAEKRQAKSLAVSFFNRFGQTQDLSPLIKEYFVKDFSKRLKFCGTTGKCGGNNRDFWQEDEEITALDATEADFQRQYISLMNYFFLYFRSLQYLNNNYPQKMNDTDMENAAKTVEKKLEYLLKNDSNLIKFNFFNNPDDAPFKFKTLNEFRKSLNDNEKFTAALRTVESNLRTRFQKQKSIATLSYLQTDFNVYPEENYNSFFDYPIETKMIEVWAENDSLFFKMDLIKENGKLKIVAIYPPMD